MLDWSFYLRTSDSKDKNLAPETNTKYARPTTVLQDVLKPQGSTTTLEDSLDNTTRSSISSTIPKDRTLQLGKPPFAWTASLSSSVYDTTSGSPSLLGDQCRNSSTSSILVSKDSAVKNRSGHGREVAAAGQADADIQTKFTEARDQPSNSYDAPPLTTKLNPSATATLTTEPTVDGKPAADFTPGETPTIDDNETVWGGLSSDLGDVPSSIVLVTNPDDRRSSITQTDLPSMRDPGLLITPKWLIDLSGSSGSGITAPTATKELPTNPPVIARDVTLDALRIDKASVSISDRGSPVEPDSETPSFQAPSKSARVKITETPVADATPYFNADDHRA